MIIYHRGIRGVFSNGWGGWSEQVADQKLWGEGAVHTCPLCPNPEYASLAEITIQTYPLKRRLQLGSVSTRRFIFIPFLSLLFSTFWSKTMVLVLDGNSEKGARVTSNFCICLARLHFCRKCLSSCIRAQHILSCLLIYVPWSELSFYIWTDCKAGSLFILIFRFKSLFSVIIIFRCK